VNYKLPFLKVIAGALYFAWTSKAELLRAIAIPTLVLVVIWALLEMLQDKMATGMLWVILLVFGLGFSFFAVTCHRLILVDSQDRYRYFGEKPGYRELKFLGWLVLVYALITVLEIPLIAMAQGVLGSVAVDERGRIVGWVKEIASIPALYVLARLSLIFPAAAIDNSVTMKWAWEKTKGNGWRMFFVVGLFPWLLEHAIGLLLRQEATAVEWVLLVIFVYIGLATGIIALSFAYKEFRLRGTI
jgi:hypothetical protein